MTTLPRAFPEIVVNKFYDKVYKTFKLYDKLIIPTIILKSIKLIYKEYN